MTDNPALEAADRLEEALDPDKRGGWTRLMDGEAGHSEIDDLRLVIAAVRERAAEEPVIQKIRDAEAEWRRTPRTLNYGTERDWAKADLHFRSQVLAILRKADGK